MGINQEFPMSSWGNMNKENQTHFRKMSKEDLIERWHSQKGEEIKKRIIEINFRYGSSSEYKSFMGTVKSDWSKIKPKIDLRGISFSGFSNLRDDEIFSFDFSDCLLQYSDFSNVDLSSSMFKNADILYSDLSNSILDGCNFSGANMTLCDLSSSNLDGSDFRNTRISDVDFTETELGYIKFNNKTDFYNIDIASVKGSSNPLLVSFLKRKQYLKHFKAQNIWNKIIYYIWLIISDCGQSFIRWLVFSFATCLVFGFMYSGMPESFFIANNRTPTPFTFYYYSVVTFTTLGFGDIVPKNIHSEIAVAIEVVLGYLMLGGLISIFATKFIPKE